MKLKQLTYTAIIALVSLSSCNDYLDKMPDTRVELDTVEQLRMLLVSSYPAANYALLGELSSDNMVDNNTADKIGTRYNLPSYDRLDDQLFAWEDAKASSGSDSPTEVWEAHYHAVAAANAVLDKVPGLMEKGENKATLNAIKGEALLLRAYSHFILANLFCEQYRGPELSKNIPGIPYCTIPETTVMVKYERGTLAEDYDKIEADIQEALPLIDDGMYEVPKYHFNKAAAYAFAARFYLFKREYDKVLEYANLALGGENANPAAMMSDIWSKTNFYYLDDFGRYITDIAHTDNFLLITNYSTFMRHLSGGKRYAINREAKRATLQGPGPTWDVFKWTSKVGNKSESFSMNPCFASMCFINGKSEYGLWLGANCAEFFEYSDKVAGIGYAHEITRAFTAEETLMCRAEAKAFLGDINGAIEDLGIWENSLRNNPQSTGSTKYRDFNLDIVKSFYASDKDGFGIVKPFHIDEVCPSDKYSVTPENEAVLQCVQHFRRILQIHTGNRWFDIKRFGLEITHVIGKEARVETLTPLDPRRALQIPSETLSAGFEPNKRETVTTGSNDPLVHCEYVNL